MRPAKNIRKGSIVYRTDDPTAMLRVKARVPPIRAYMENSDGTKTPIKSNQMFVVERLSDGEPSYVGDWLLVRP